MKYQATTNIEAKKQMTDINEFQYVGRQISCPSCQRQAMETATIIESDLTSGKLRWTWRITRKCTHCDKFSSNVFMTFDHPNNLAESINREFPNC
jgi:hypothetical protein